MKTIVVSIAVVLLIAATAHAAPKAVVVVTETPAGLVILDARRSVGSLTWRINGEHSIIFGGRVAVCRETYAGALAAVSSDGTVDLILLPIRSTPPLPPSDNLAALVAKLAKDLPADQRAEAAKVHNDLADRILSGEVKTITAAVRLRREGIQAVVSGAEWTALWSKVGVELNRMASKGLLVNVKDYVEPYRAIARGLKP